MSVHQCSDDNPNWKGGACDRFGSNWYRIRERVEERDRVCQVCGDPPSTRALDVHHIVPRSEFDVVEESNAMGNLVLLCRSCHKRVEHGSIPCPSPERTENTENKN
ncbi:HNH endonuclease [Halobacteriaceae archaeon GCM10025711]